MHHEPANKLDRVATPLPLSLSCQVEPLKHSRSSPLHFHLSIQSSPHLTIQRSSSRHTSVPPPTPTPRMLYLHTHKGCRYSVWSPSPLSFLFIYPSLYPSFSHYFIFHPAQISTFAHKHMKKVSLCFKSLLCCPTELKETKKLNCYLYIFLKEYYSTYYDQSINAR